MASQSIEHGAGAPVPRSDGHTWKGTALGALRGVGQVDFQASLWCSLVILVALWVAGCSPPSGRWSPR
ncbi:MULTISPECIES: urea transporter [Streptomyces]|uniref:urea transporter n=1 Tax=Streptomyces TaxID=1883 RepID=UPI001FFDD7F3|nr:MULTISPECIES: urea transporter [unclassified Streptomyces]